MLSIDYRVNKQRIRMHVDCRADSVFEVAHFYTSLAPAPVCLNQHEQHQDATKKKKNNKKNYMKSKLNRYAPNRYIVSTCHIFYCHALITVSYISSLCDCFGSFLATVKNRISQDLSVHIFQSFWKICFFNSHRKVGERQPLFDSHATRMDVARLYSKLTKRRLSLSPFLHLYISLLRSAQSERKFTIRAISHSLGRTASYYIVTISILCINCAHRLPGQTRNEVKM